MVGLDSLLILLSYVMILKTVLSIASHVECVRALNTCVYHLCTVLLFYAPEIGLSVIGRFGNSSPPFRFSWAMSACSSRPNHVQREMLTPSREDNQGVHQVKGNYVTRL
ncbi:Olfactory receptor 51G2 [Chelonia mydas]|uniref:Olfactory receptor 51G2 n=1 Tax=Chelonia mydas TaxID=8469 RepID=M7AP13_CHEMY|nr:Olfactory receptor 51G2 [Chelonia mydas]